MYDYDLEKKTEWLKLNDHSRIIMLELTRLLSKEKLENHEKERIYFLSDYFDRAGISICCAPNGLVSKELKL
jgi:hypothetical protein